MADRRSSDRFFIRVTIHAEKTSSLVALAQQCKLKFSVGVSGEADAAAWAENVFTPHVSLVYSNMASEKVKAAVLPKVAEAIDVAGIVVGAGTAWSQSEMSGWKGGRILLVQTFKAIDEWKAIAEKVV